MPKLSLKFGGSTLKEISIGEEEISIGRSPHSTFVIDNPAISHSHARVFTEAGRLMLEDFGSLNGTFVNGQRVKKVALKSGDSVAIGKHTIFILESAGTADSAARSNASMPAISKVDETVVLDTRERRQLLQKLAAEGESSQVSPDRLKVPTLIVLRGKTDQREYTLTDRLTVIGKSAMASVKLRGWFAPKVAAQISRREGNTFYIGVGGRVPTVNGRPASRPTKLCQSDVIEIAGVRLEFRYRD